MRLKWTESTVIKNTYRTQKIGNLLRDTKQGEVNYCEEGNFWSGWVTNHSDHSKTIFKLGFSSKAAAQNWVRKEIL